MTTPEVIGFALIFVYPATIPVVAAFALRFRMGESQRIDEAIGASLLWPVVLLAVIIIGVPYCATRLIAKLLGAEISGESA